MNRNQPQVHRALDASSPFDAMLRARLRMTVGEPLGEQSPLITPPDTLAEVVLTDETVTR